VNSLPHELQRTLVIVVSGWLPFIRFSPLTKILLRGELRGMAPKTCRQLYHATCH
jgi:hypothetical protein